MAGSSIWRGRLSARRSGTRVGSPGLAYSRFPRERQLLTHAVEAGFIEAERPFAGCVLCLRLLELPQHLAIMTDRGMVHACQNTGRVIEHRMDSTWRDRVVAVLRYPGT